MPFAKRPAPSRGRPTPRLPRAAPVLLIRTFLLGAMAIAGAAWALTRHYTHELPPLGGPRTAPTYDADAGEMPVPEIIAHDGD
ncbi:MAG: hypothetical protein ABSF69_00085 [Polyangiaceae bacterium]